MRRFKFNINAIMINGSLATVLFFLLSWLQFGISISSDTAQIWLIIVVLVTAFMMFICEPVFWLLAKLRIEYLNSVIGVLLGFVSVFIGVTFFIKPAADIWHYMVNNWIFYVMFGTVGAVFGWLYRVEFTPQIVHSE